MEKPVIVTVEDPETGERGRQELGAGQYVVVCGERMYISHEQVYTNGTRVVTIKRRPL